MRLELFDLHKYFDSHIIFDHVNFSVSGSGLWSVIGPSGAGKSTLLRILSGLDRRISGRVVINGKEIPFRDKYALREYRRQNAVVFQQHNLLPHLDVLRNITFPLRHIRHTSVKKAEAAAMELLERFKLAEHAHKYSYQLSGGQSQRIAVARALVVQPSILFLDEPTASLDPEMRYEVLRMVLEVQKSGTHIILVTHNIRFALQCGAHFLFVDDKNIHYYTAENITNPESGSSIEQFLRYSMV